MQSSHPTILNKPPSMGPPSTSSSTPPHSTLKHHKLHPTAKTLKPNPPTPKSAVTAQDAPNKQRHHTLSSSSEEDTDPQGNQNDWQQIHRKKRIRSSNSQPTLQIPQTPIQNRYEMLISEPPITAQEENTHPPQVAYTTTDFSTWCDKL
jgi:hypothetical protein